MPPGPDPAGVVRADAALDALAERVATVEEEILASLTILGEPDGQRVVDAWCDQCADTLRAIGEVGGERRDSLSALSRSSRREHGAGWSGVPADFPTMVSPGQEA